MVLLVPRFVSETIEHNIQSMALPVALLNADTNQSNTFDRRITLIASKRNRPLASVLVGESTLIMRDRSMKADFIAIILVIVFSHIHSSPIVTTNCVAAWVLNSKRLLNSSAKSRTASMKYLSPYEQLTKQSVSNGNVVMSYGMRDKSSQRRATVESTRNIEASFSASDDDDEEDGYSSTVGVRQQDMIEDDENYKDFNNAAIEHSQQQELENRKNSGNNGQMISMNNRNKPRNDNSNRNTAFHDPSFLRKRTADLLKVTDDVLVIGSPRSTGSIDATNGTPTSSTPHLGRHMKVEKKTFHFLLDAWAFSGESDAAEQAKALLRRMEELGQRSSAITMNPIQPDVRSYTKAMNAIARQATINSGDDAEILLEKMKSMFAAATHTDPEYAASIKPNTYTYTAVIQAHANSGAVGSPERAEALVERMIDKYQRGDDSVRPTAKTFNAIIHAYGKARNAERAAAVFHRMEKLYESGVTVAKPNAINYNALITAWANCDLPDSAQRAEAVLEKMENMYKKGDKALKPTTVSFNAVIDAYAKSGEGNAAQKAEELLRHMYVLYEAGNVEAKPNTRSFNSVINAWAKSGDPNAASNAAELLELMEEKYEEGDTEVRPDVHSFCTTINGTFANAALHLFPIVIKFTLCVSIFSICHVAYARSGLSDKAERASNLYNDMKKLYLAGNQHVRPNVVAVNAVLNACAFTTTGDDIRLQNRVVEIAHSILKELEQSPNVFGKPDQVTYGTFMKTCANQMPDSHTRQQIVEILFKKCCKDGQVGDLVLQQFRSMASDELFQQLIGRSKSDASLRIEDLPKEWSCNVVEGKWRRRRNQQG